MEFSLIILLLVPLVSSRVKINQGLEEGLLHQLVLTDSANINFTFVTDQPDLTEEEIDDVAQVCNTGVWVIYDGVDYQSGEQGNNEILPSLATSCKSPQRKIQSARTVGKTANGSFLISVTFFSGPSFQGQAYEAEGNISNTDFSFESIIAIGIDVELFSEPNYAGERFCMALGPNCTQLTCWMHNPDDIVSPFKVNSAKSIGFGKCRNDVGECRNDVGDCSNGEIIKSKTAWISLSSILFIVFRK